jgi:TPR repeat protein
MYANGKGVTQDDFKAVKYYQKACGLKLPLGCKNYARLKK